MVRNYSRIELEKLCINNGLVRGPFGGALKKEIFVKSGYKVYEQKNAIYRNCNIGDYYIDEEKYTELTRFKIRHGDFIVSCSGTIGKIYRIPNKAKAGVINQALLKITIDEKICNPTYFYKYFAWDKFQKEITDDTQGGAMKNLVGMDVFKSTLISLPELKEQQAIADALSDIDDLIHSLEKLIEKKKAIKQGIMQKLLIGKKRIDGFEGDWLNINLSEHSKIKARIGWQGLTTEEYLDQGYAYLVTGTDFLDGRIDWDNCHFVNEERFAQDKNIQIMNGDILITKDGTIGKVAYVMNLNSIATLNSGVFVIRAKHPQEYDSGFVYYILKSSVFTEFLNKLSAGSTINHLYQKDFVNFTFDIPQNIEEQTVIAEILFDMDSEITTLESKLLKYRQIKQGMMQELLTGRIRLM